MTDDQPLVRSHATFVTDLFGESGEDLIAWLIARLPPLALEIGEAIEEDYGWGFWAKAGKDTFWVCASQYPEVREDWNEDEDPYFEEEGEAPPEPTAEAAGPSGPVHWGLVAAYDPGLSLIRRFFHQPDLGLQRQLCEALDRALHGEPRIRDIRWWATGFEEGASAEHPVGG